MSYLKTGLKAAFLAASCLTATALYAQKALVVVNHDPTQPHSGIRDKAADVSEMLFGLGYTPARKENLAEADLLTELQKLSSETGPVVIYFVGQSESEDGQTLLQLRDDGRISLADMVDRAGVAGRDQTIVFLDICGSAPQATPTPASAAEDTLANDAEPEGAAPAAIGDLPGRDGLFIATPVAAGADCTGASTTLTDVLLERLLVPGLDITALFQDTPVQTVSSIGEPFVFRSPDSGRRLTADEYRMLDNLSPETREEMLALYADAGMIVDSADAPSPTTGARNTVVTRETVVLTTPVQPVSTGGARLVPVRPAATTVSDGVRLAPRVPTPTPASAVGNVSRPVPGAGGLPQPYIIVGRITPTEASFGTAIEETEVTGATVEFTAEERRALRDSDPEGFASLLDAGAFDPPSAELAVALQTELQRMNCYTAGIDGDWGPGSRRSVVRYFEQLGEPAPTQDPNVALFRQIALRDDVRCPDIVVAQPSRPAATPARNNNSRPRTQQAARQPAQAQPAPAPAPAPAQPQNPRRINGGVSTIGVIR